MPSATERWEIAKARMEEIQKEYDSASVELGAARENLMCELANTAAGLTRREKEVLDLVRQGLLNKEIGDKLNIGERTVKYHVSSLLVKFRVRSRFGLF